jgi:predicted permease
MNWFRQLFTRNRIYSDLSEEIDQHLAEKVDSLMASGMSRPQAEQAARREFGNVTRINEQGREIWMWSYIESILADVGFAVRKLRRSPGFVLITVLTLTMAIAANVVVFGIFNALLFHPLPVSHAQQLVQIQGKPANSLSLSYPNYRDIRDRNSTFSDVGVYRLARIGLGVNGVAQPVWGYEASGNYFDMLGVQPVLGRFFHAAEDTKVNGSQLAVLSYSGWQGRFAGDPKIVGKIVLLNKHPYTILGVAPENFSGTERFIWPEIWVPFQNQPEIEGYNSLDRRYNNNAWVVGRLKPGVTPTQADADLGRIASQLAEEYPMEDKTLTLRVAKLGLLGDALGGPVRAFLTGVMLLALLVLLAACANLGGLFAARTADRARELGIRIAIGSSRGRIVRQLLTESVIISLIGGAAAAILAATLLRALTHWRPAHIEIPVQFLTEPNISVYLFAAMLAMLTGLIFGVIPARQVWRTDPNETLKAAGDTGYKEHRFTGRDVLLVVQIALCCLLVTSSFVAVRGLQRTFTVPLGLQPENVTIATLDLHLAGYHDAAVATVQKRLLDAVAGLPGVSGAAYADTTPLSINNSNTMIFAPGTTDFSVANSKFYAPYFQVSPAYFAVAGTQLLAGRVFTEHDGPHAPLVAIVNETFARRLFGTVDVLGKHFPSGGGQKNEIVGVVKDGKYATLTEDPTSALFWPIQQSGSSDTVLLVRSTRSLAEMIPAVRQAIANIDNGIPVFTLSSWSDSLSLMTFPARAATVALGVLGVLAILLAVTGIFGLANYTVSRRIRELGIRTALGARSNQVLRAALGKIGWLLGIGSFAGLLLGIAASRLLVSIVDHATAADPLVILAVVLTMALVGLLSGTVPARRALNVDPARLLRDE